MWHGYSLIYGWGPIFITIIIVVGLIIFALIKIKSFPAIFISFSIAFILPIIIGNLIHLSGVLPPHSGGSLPLPNNVVDIVIVLYYILPIPFSIPTVLSIILYKNYFSKKFQKSSK